MLISLWAWGLVGPGQTNILIGKQIVNGRLLKKVQKRERCVYGFSHLSHAGQGMSSTYSPALSVSGAEDSATVPFSSSTSGQDKWVAMCLLHSTLPWAVVGGGEHYLRYRPRMGPLFIYFQDTSHKFTAEWLRTWKSELWRGLAISDVFVVCSLHLY